VFDVHEKRLLDCAVKAVPRIEMASIAKPACARAGKS